jgi:hypothetical protein
MFVFIEGLAMCFLLLITCVIGIANGPAGLVVFYEKPVQDRVIALGYTTKKKIKNSFIITAFALFVPVVILVPIMVYCINGAASFWEGFWQMTAINWIAGLFDRLFIDWYWVGHTKAWIIPGTEDLRPYIPGKVMLAKWLGTIFLYPALSAVIAWVISLFS